MCLIFVVVVLQRKFCPILFFFLITTVKQFVDGISRWIPYDDHPDMVSESNFPRNNLLDWFFWFSVWFGLTNPKNRTFRFVFGAPKTGNRRTRFSVQTANGKTDGFELCWVHRKSKISDRISPWDGVKQLNFRSPTIM